MVLCVSCEAGLSTKAQKCEVHWVGTDWICASFKCCETAQSLHENIPLMRTYQVFNGLSITALAVCFNQTKAENMRSEKVLPSRKEAQMRGQILGKTFLQILLGSICH